MLKRNSQQSLLDIQRQYFLKVIPRIDTEMWFCFVFGAFFYYFINMCVTFLFVCLLCMFVFIQKLNI